jgi:hypothetical protein
MVVHACNPSTLEAETGGKRVKDQPVLHSEFQASLGYTVLPSLPPRTVPKQNF